MCINIVQICNKSGCNNPLLLWVEERRKDMQEQKRKELLKDLLIVGVPIVVFMFWILTKWSITYQVHDDRFMMEFLSGKFLGHSDAHLIYIKYLLAVLLMAPYKLFAGHDWYSTEMLFIQFITIAIITWYIVRKQKKVVHKLLSQGLFYSVFILCWVNEIACFTYTTVAALVGAAIVVVYVLGEQRKRDLVLIMILCFITYNLRTDLFLMVLPVCGILWIDNLFQGKKKFQIVLLVGLVVVVGGSWLGNRMAYHSNGWSEYTTYNEDRTNVYDFYFEDMFEDGKYEENREIFERLGINEKQWWIIKSYDLYLCNQELYDKMDDIAVAYESPRTLGERLKNAATNVLSEGLMKSKMMTLVSVVLWLLVLFTIIYLKDKRGLTIAVCFALIHLLLWGYLGYKGRILPRVSHSMLLLQIVTPLVCLYILWSGLQKTKLSEMYRKVLRIGLFGIFVVTSLLAIKTANKTKNNMELESSYVDQYVIEEYCASQPDKFFFLDVFSVEECKYFYDFNNANDYENFISLGDWYGNSPLSVEKLKREHIDHVQEAVKYDRSIRIIGKEERSLKYIEDILGEEYSLVEEERLDGVQHDYIVYRVEIRQE